jgi:uncharacterized protein YdaT
MAEGRSLLTEREREILAGNADVKDNYRYKVESYARNRINGIERDVEVLREHHPELYEHLKEIVCQDEAEG